MKNFFSLALTIVIVSCTQSHALTIDSLDVKPKSTLTSKQVFNGFGCKGENISPQIGWKDAPKDAKSFALTVYDPDAPTGSGWWHWLVVNIPTNYQELSTNFGAKDSFALKDGILQIKNDFGLYRFGGACPPQGDKPHKYIFTVHALKVDKLDLNESSSAALAGYFINQNTIAKVSFNAFYSR